MLRSWHAYSSRILRFVKSLLQKVHHSLYPLFDVPKICSLEKSVVWNFFLYFYEFSGKIIPYHWLKSKHQQLTVIMCNEHIWLCLWRNTLKINSSLCLIYQTFYTIHNVVHETSNFDMFCVILSITYFQNVFIWNLFRQTDKSYRLLEAHPG